MEDELRTYEQMKEILNPDEMSALWTHHHDAELQCANKGDYHSAKYHKEQKPLYYRQPNTPP